MTYLLSQVLLRVQLYKTGTHRTVFTDYEPFAIFAGLFNYMVSQKKTVHFCFCQNSVKFPRLKLYAVYTIST